MKSTISVTVHDKNAEALFEKIRLLVQEEFPNDSKIVITKRSINQYPNKYKLSEVTGLKNISVTIVTGNKKLALRVAYKRQNKQVTKTITINKSEMDKCIDKTLNFFKFKYPDIEFNKELVSKQIKDFLIELQRKLSNSNTQL